MEILPFSIQQIIEQCAKATGNKSFGGDCNKRHFDYFDKYLKELECKTIVVEEDYISKDYLENYKFYFSSCFQDFKRKCIRLHFFKSKESEKSIDKAILADEKEKLNENYLGYMVLRPIPNKEFGFTILKTYNGKRKFFGNRKYEVNFFGVKLEIESLAFQEQDGALSACATTSVWSVLNKTNYLNYTLYKTPISVTQDADFLASNGSRIFPNKGLTVKQIGNAFYKAGLATEVITNKESNIKYLEANKKENVTPEFLIEYQKSQDEKYLELKRIKRLIRAYSPLGIPILATIQPTKNAGLHSIVISGYNITRTKELKTKYHFELIDRLYAHDDQFGPFTKIELSNSKKYGLDTIWTEESKENNGSKLLSFVVVYNKKVRITEQSIFAFFQTLQPLINDILNSVIEDDFLGKSSRNYDYYCIRSNSYKEEVKKLTIPDEEKLKILKSSLPKYIWVLSFYQNHFRLFDIIVDSTDIISNVIVIDTIHYHNAIKEGFVSFDKKESKKLIESTKKDLRSRKFNPLNIDEII